VVLQYLLAGLSIADLEVTLIKLLSISEKLMTSLKLILSFHREQNFAGAAILITPQIIFEAKIKLLYLNFLVIFRRR